MLERLQAKREQVLKEINELQAELNYKIVKYNLLEELINEEVEHEAQPVEEVQPQEEAQPNEGVNTIY